MIAVVRTVAALVFAATATPVNADAARAVTVTVVDAGGAAVVRADGTPLARTDSRGLALVRVAPGTLIEARTGDASSPVTAVTVPGVT